MTPEIERVFGVNYADTTAEERAAATRIKSALTRGGRTECATDLWVAVAAEMRIAVARHATKMNSVGADFWMVYREGGRSPSFKHTAEESAVAEAKRIARESGEATYVLSAIHKVEPHALPTPEEFARHASAHPYGIAGTTTWGLWRVCVEGRLPAVIAVRCGKGGPYASYDSPGGSCLPIGGKWFPLDANGKDLVDDGVPF